MPDAEIRLRAATRDDAEVAGPLVAASAAELTGPIFGFDDVDRAIRYFARLFATRWTDWSFDITTVAEQDRRVVGMVSHRPAREELWRGVMSGAAVMRVYGLLGSARLGWRARHLVSPRRPAGRGDHYIPFLAVDAGHRNRGIGSMLLDSAHAAAREAGASRVGLEVLIENHAGRRLYERHGYAEVARKQSEGLRRLTGISGLIYMARPIEGASAPD